MFSEQEEILPELMRSLPPSPTDTSAPFLSTPALTDTLRNFPLFSSRAVSSEALEPAEGNEPQEGTDSEIKNQNKI